MMEHEYTIECPICDMTTVIRVQYASLYEDEVPCYCPMCGADAEAEESD
jgi:endogenous inhibitor of DNA gyrase (YacG/DUF329 family)